MALVFLSQPPVTEKWVMTVERSDTEGRHKVPYLTKTNLTCKLTLPAHFEDHFILLN